MTISYDDWITALPEAISEDIGIWLADRLTETADDYDILLALIQEFSLSVEAES